MRTEELDTTCFNKLVNGNFFPLSYCSFSPLGYVFPQPNKRKLFLQKSLKPTIDLPQLECYRRASISVYKPVFTHAFQHLICPHELALYLHQFSNQHCISLYKHSCIRVSRQFILNHAVLQATVFISMSQQCC